MTKKLLSYNLIFILITPILYWLIGAWAAFEGFIVTNDKTGLLGIISFVLFAVYLVIIFAVNRKAVQAGTEDEKFFKAFGFTGFTFILALLLVVAVEKLLFL